MNKELEKTLMEKYPKIFPQKTEETKDEPIYEWGIECHDGWYNLLDSCFDLIQRYIDSRYDKTKQVIACQIKQKYGSLRFYYDGGDDVVDGIVRTIEYLSHDICEDCGTSGPVKTVCNSCNNLSKSSKKFYAEQFEFNFNG